MAHIRLSRSDYGLGFQGGRVEGTETLLEIAVRLPEVRHLFVRACGVEGVGFMVWGLGSGIQGLGFGVKCLRFMILVLCSFFIFYCFLLDEGMGLRVGCMGFRVWGLGLGVGGSGAPRLAPFGVRPAFGLTDYRGTSLMRNTPSLGPYSRPVPSRPGPRVLR